MIDLYLELMLVCGVWCCAHSAFIFCWSPYFVFNLLDTYGLLSSASRQQKYAVSVFIQSLAPLNSVANPIIYIVFSTAVLHGIRYELRGFLHPRGVNAPQLSYNTPGFLS